MVFKGVVENKTQSQGTFEDAFGRRYTRADLEDPARPGYLREELVPIEPGVWAGGGHFGLLSPTGRPLRYVEQRPNPHEPRTEEAPAKLRQELEAAQREFDTLNAERARLADEVGRAEAGIEEVTALAYTRHIGADEALTRGAEFEARRVTAMERLREFDHFRLPPMQTRLSEAQQKLKRWMDDERLRRSGRA